MTHPNEGLASAHVSSHEKKEGMAELEAVPVFRNNDLYAALFPEIKPAFEKGEQVSPGRVLEAISKHVNQTVILDTTCASDFANPLEPRELEVPNLLAELGLSELPLRLGGRFVDMDAIAVALKEKKGIIVSFDTLDTIDYKIQKTVYDGASFPEISESLYGIAKQKHPDIKKIYILTSRIADHIDVPREEKSQAAKNAIEALIAGARSHFGTEPELVGSVPAQLDPGDHVIADRHEGIDSVRANPTQYSILPIETEISNNESYIGETYGFGEGFVNMLRKKFEKQ